MQPDRRKVIRFVSNLDIEIVLEDSTILSAQACDISLNGLQFKCDGYTANEIEPRGIQNFPLDHIKLKIVATLPVSDNQKFYAICKIVTARRLSQEGYILGLEFIDFENNTDEVLNRYIEQLVLEAQDLNSPA